MKTRKPPKDMDKYLPPRIAAGRLLHLAMEHVLFLRRGVRIKWQLKISYYYSPEYVENPKAIVQSLGGTFTSGDLPDGWVD